MAEWRLAQPQPAAQILSLALLTLLLSRAQLSGLIFASGPLMWLMFTYTDHVTAIFRLISRLRWFFLSILILYAWFTPATHQGEGLFSEYPGLLLGIERVLALVIIVSYAGMMLLLSSRDDIITGIYVLLAPLKRVGLEPERLAVRLGLVLAYVPRFEQMQSNYSPQAVESYNWIDRVSMLYANASSGGEPGQGTSEPIALPDSIRISAVDILLPAALIALIIVT